MGDPECQVIIPRLKTDLVKIFDNVIKNKLNRIQIKWKKEKSMTMVLCSKGYPGNYKNNKKLVNLDKVNLDKKSYIFHAGTKIHNGDLVSNGGRVLNFTVIGLNFLDIRKKIIKMIKKLNWKDGFYRRDIGWKVIHK